MHAFAQAAAKAIANNVVHPSMTNTSKEDMNASSFPPAPALASESPIIGLDESDVIPSLETQATAKAKGKSIISHKLTCSLARLAARGTTPRSVAGGISFRVICNEDQPLVNSSSSSSTDSVQDGGFDRSDTISSFYKDH
ncbi:hypothetical protein AMTRI_Chr10g2680 [Amborella trichopoda]